MKAESKASLKRKVSDDAKMKPPENGESKIKNRRNSVTETKEDSLTWPQEDIRMLLSRMKQHIPHNDRLSHQNRAKLLPWEEITFNDYTGEECFKMWKLVLQRQRGYRLLGEILSDSEHWLDRPWTNFYASKKLNRHPDQPKRPLTANALYLKQHYQKFKDENPTLSAKHILKLSSETFKSLSEKKKAKYNKKANILKEEYEQKMAAFLQEHPNEKYVYKPKKPKKLTAFNLYLEHQLLKHGAEGDHSAKILYNDIRTKWKNMKDSKKLVWISKAEDLEREIFESTAGQTKPKSLLTKNEKKMSDRAKGKPDKPSPNVYAYFTQILLSSGEFQKYDSKERMKHVALKWKKTKEEEKKELAAQLALQKQNYKNKLREYYEKYPEEAEQGLETSTTSIKSKKKIHEDEIKPKVSKLDEDDWIDPKAEVASPVKVKQPPSDPMKYYAKLMKKTVKYKSEKELTEAWNNLTKKERKQYKKLHAAAIEAFQNNQL